MPQLSARDQIELEAYSYEEPTEEYKQLAEGDVERVRREMESNW